MTAADPVATYIGQIRAAGVTTVIIAWQDEWDLTDAKGFGPVLRARLLAYRGGDIFALDVANVERDVLAARLRAAGLTIELRSRNQA